MLGTKNSLMLFFQEHVENVLQLGVHRRDGIGKLAAVLKHRMQVSFGTRPKQDELPFSGAE